MELLIDDMVSTALFHIIDVKTSYNMLLDRPWLNENFVVPSTWHQCFKYYRNSTVRKVLGDSKSFTEAESHYVDAKYYIKDANKGKEVLPSEEQKSYNSQSMRKNDSSAIEVELSKGLTLSLTQINMKQPSKLPLKGFVSSTQEEKGHEALAIDGKEFESKAFKLLLKEKGCAVQDSRVGLGFTPPKPVRIIIKRVSSNYAVKEFSSTEDDKREETRESVFNRLGPIEEWCMDL
ncbi:UNVERIFIED_CONTAM: hypothetical protein Slati_4201600 [Sesamum latifolium]|uniref:Uncharacterized protein n=1 Tax=Sesamum latifolium TaxID=2727402 RepID=A0AAW2TAT3_9LAMI